MATADPAHALTDFGFTALESEIYAFLLRESPATGYRIAQAIGKPAANTYKAIQTLEHKGAILVDDGENRLCRAVPSDELLARLTREFETKRAAAHQALSHLGSSSADERIYQIRSADQVLHRAREMLGEAKQVVLASLHGEMVTALTGALEATASRSVDVALKAPRAFDLEAVECVVANDALTHWPGRELRLAVDGSQFLSALMSTDGSSVIQAVWSRSPFLSLSMHNSLASEICFVALAQRIEEGAGQKRLTRTISQFRSATSTPGFESLRTRA